MRIAVIGAGVIGVTTAFELASDGHEVSLYEQRSSVAAESSFANAGVVSPGYVAPWSAPGMPGKILRGFLKEHSAVSFDGLPGPRLWSWLWRWWRACEARGYAERRAQMLALAQFSQQRLRLLAETLDLGYERRRGYLVLLREQAELDRIKPGLDVMAELGLHGRLIDEAACRAIEPGLHAQTALQAGVHWPDDEVGNCRQFALQLLERAVTHGGVKPRLHHTVQEIQHDGHHIRLRIHVQEAPRVSRLAEPSPALPPETESVHDAVVLCTGASGCRLHQKLRLRLPLAAVHGYSVTAPLRHHQDAHLEVAPRAAVMDEAYKVAISRIGDRVRVAGSGELAGRLDKLAKKPVATLYKVLHDWFPAGTNLSLATTWKGARPMLPDGPPLIGATRHRGVWINLGHGSSGWALACGSARVLADQIAGRAPPIDARGFLLQRYD